jgi:Thioredoxin-like [2Fe-2S] ferredoxin
MHFLSRTKFDLTGELAGFVRNREGKRRMLLRVEESEPVALKLPKDLRRALESRLAPGVRVAVLGIEYRDFAGESKYVVSHLRVLSPAPSGTLDACEKCPIQVCAKKNCWKNGGKELFERLQVRVAQLGLESVVNVKAVGCLDNCKRRANAECGKRMYERCDAESVDEIIERVKERVSC